MLFVSYVWELFVVMCCAVMLWVCGVFVIFVLSVIRVVVGVSLWVVCLGLLCTQLLF